MKIYAIGDPHGDLDKIKKIPLSDADLILLTGDLGSANLARETTFKNMEKIKKGLPEKKQTKNKIKKAHDEIWYSASNVLSYLSQFAPVYTILGNVENSNPLVEGLDDTLSDLPQKINKLKTNTHYFGNKKKKINTVTIGGLDFFTDIDWVENFEPPKYDERMFIAEKGTKKAKSLLKSFGKVDILVCHQPPYGILDKVTAKVAPKNWRGKHAGSKIILKYIKSKSPKYVFCGHIHESQGMKKVGETEIYNLGIGEYKIVELP